MSKNLLHFSLKTLALIITITLFILSLYPQVCNGIFDYYHRNSGFVKVVKGNQEIYLLGTYHSGHWDSKKFSLLHLKAVIENLKPDILLVESRQGQLEQGNLADGPLEMLYTHLTAKRIGIPVKGIDWWEVEAIKQGITDNQRDRNITENIIKCSDRSKRALVLIGRAHINSQLSNLKAKGYKEVRLTNAQKDILFELTTSLMVYPKGMDFYIKRRIACEREWIKTIYKSEEHKDYAYFIIESLEEFSKKIEAVGEQ